MHWKKAQEDEAQTEKDFVYTNLGQMVREIILLAIRFNADVSIEQQLSKFNPKGRRYNKKVFDSSLLYFQKGFLKPVVLIAALR
jgi:hypothetical protein